MEIRIFPALICLALLSACAIAVIPQATGGSRADGTVEFSYWYGAFTNPVPGWTVADQQATLRCGDWGYSGANRFGAGTQECSNYYNGSCQQMAVTVVYQCSGQPDTVR